MGVIYTGGFTPICWQVKMTAEQGLAADMGLGALITGISVGAALIFGQHITAGVAAITFGTFSAVWITTNYLEKRGLLAEGAARSIDMIALAICFSALTAGLFALGVTGPVMFGFMCAGAAFSVALAGYYVYTAARTGHSPSYHDAKVQQEKTGSYSAPFWMEDNRSVKEWSFSCSLAR
jgi:hypothetical protein